jgi:hypothetical protein
MTGKKCKGKVEGRAGRIDQSNLQIDEPKNYFTIGKLFEKS